MSEQKQRNELKSSSHKGVAMNLFKKAKDVGVKAVAKHKVRNVVNEKLNLNGQHDEKIDELTEKVIDKIGVDNILKAKKINDILKK